MQPTLSFSLAVVLAAQCAGAAAGTMFKCVDARGKTAYTERPCPADAKAARQFAVPAPESAEAGKARMAQERLRRRAASDSMQRQLDVRSSELDAATRYGPRPGQDAPYYGDDSGAASTLRRARGVVGQSSPLPMKK